MQRDSHPTYHYHSSHYSFLLPSPPPPLSPHHIYITYQVLPFLNISTPSLVCYPLASNVIIFTSCHPFHNTSSLSTSCSNVAVIASSHFGITGLATAVGEQPVKGLLNNKAQARMTVGETGILFMVRTERPCLVISLSFFLPFFYISVFLFVSTYLFLFLLIILFFYPYFILIFFLSLFPSYLHVLFL